MSETTFLYIYSTLMVLIFLRVCFNIVYAGGYIRKVGEEQNNSNLIKAGKKLSFAGNLLSITLILNLFIGCMILVAKWLYN